MSWRSGYKAGAAVLGAFAAISVVGGTAVAIGVAEAGGTAQVAVASVADASTASADSATAVTYQVSRTAQRWALAHWTVARMLAATATSLPRSLARTGLPTTNPVSATNPVGTQPARSQSGSQVKAPKGTPTASPFNGSPTTGVLFYTTGGKSHFCTASVVISRQGDLALTAAHCVYWKGFATNIEYVPGYHNGKQPYGAWPIAKITVAQGWKNSHDPDLDFAFLTIDPQGGQQIQARTGGLTMGFTRWYSEKIEVIGHNDTDGDPIRCATKSFRFRVGQMEFYCHGFWTGTSGGPWILGYNAKNGTGTVFGVIGGYELGGKYEWASYSAYFGSATRILFGQVERQSAPTPMPTTSPTPNTSSPSPSPASPTPTTSSASPTTVSPSPMSTTPSPTLSVTGTPTPTPSPTGSVGSAYRPIAARSL